MSASWEAEVRVTPREGILDPEGETIARALANLGYQGVDRVRAGRLFRLRLAAESAEAARSAVERMCEELIANPVIEDFAVTVSAAEEDDAAGESAAGSTGA